MVYCGKPSSACGLCRSRRIKCDRALPSCTQCQKKKLTCSGYRNQLDLMFRNETTRVVSKQRRTPPEQRSALILSPAIRAQTPEDHALCYFANYIADEKAMGNYRAYSFIPQLLTKHTSAVALDRVVTAIGLSELSKSHNEPMLRRAASENYGSALNLLNAALRDPLESHSDATLACVLLMGEYEMDHHGRWAFVEAWKNHMHGAAALLSKRGAPQLNTEIGRQLFLGSRTQIFMSALHTDEPIPEGMEELSAIFSHLAPTTKHPIRLLPGATSRYFKLRAREKQAPEAAKPQLAIEAIELATELDHNLDSEVFAELDDSRAPRQRDYDITAMQAIALVTHYRIITLLVHRVVIEICTDLQSIPKLSLQTLVSKARVVDLIHAVCTGLPYDIGFGRSVHVSELSQSDIATLHLLARDLMVWPLTCCATTPECPVDTREWIITFLADLGHLANLPLATRMAYHLTTRSFPQVDASTIESV